jgi:hypothetical protein
MTEPAKKRTRAQRRKGGGTTTRHSLQAWWFADLLPMAVQGYGPKQIAVRLGKNKGTITLALKHPTMREALQKAQEAAWAKCGERIGRMMQEDIPKNIAFLQAVRDNELADDKAEVRDRIQAATRLMDSQLSRKTSSTQQITGRTQVDVNVVSGEEALDITALAIEAGIDLPALPAPEEP